MQIRPNAFRQCAAAVLLAAVAAYAHGAAAETSTVQERLDGAVAGLYETDSDHAYLALSYTHKGLSRPILLFRQFDATLNLDVEALSKSVVIVDIDVTSIDSGVDKFDDHLKSDDFFDVAKFPKASFVSTSFVPGGDGGVLTGDLTIRDVTKPIALDVTLNKAVGGDQPAIGFSARGSLKRSDFGVGKYVPVVGDDVDLTIEIEFEAPATEK